jgi:hypothetical protein
MVIDGEWQNLSVFKSSWSSRRHCINEEKFKACAISWLSLKSAHCELLPYTFRKHAMVFFVLKFLT